MGVEYPLMVKESFVNLKMQNGKIWKHQVVEIGDNELVRYSIIMISGIPRGGENKKDYDPVNVAPLWLDGPGVTTFRSSPTGLGKSEGDTFQSTLLDRINLTVQVSLFAKERHQNSKLIIVASSMGGHVAIRAAAELAKQKINIEAVLLSSPCFYPDQSETALVGDDFRSKANIHNSGQNLADFRAMKELIAYSGAVFAFYQEYDSDLERHGVPDIELVKKEVERAVTHRNNNKDDYFVVKGGEHSFSVDGIMPDEAVHSGTINKRETSSRALKFLHKL